ncbi:MAG TPA: hypothetical protein VFT74_02750, partial [Isosphaeraceae bacterium]|nr:hypothetical protein [Isosphaeraceae bacterium]
RLARVRSSLETQEEERSLKASVVTIEGEGIRLTDALRQLQLQSGNRVTDLREVYGAEATNPGLDLKIRDQPFFQALDAIAREAGVKTTAFTGDGSIGLMPDAEAGLPDMIGVEPPDPLRWVRYDGPFRVALLNIGATRDLATGSGRANVQMELSWEPRLRPMLLEIKSDELEILDDQDRTVLPDVMGESTSVPLRPENPSVEVNLNMEAPERDATRLKTLKLSGSVSAPAGLRRFRFSDLKAKDEVQTQEKIVVTLVGSEVEDQVWKLSLSVEMPGEGQVFDSYQQGLFNNRLWLERADGSRFEHNGGFSSVNLRPGVIGFEYLFVDAPGKLTDYSLVYETPSRVVSVPFTLNFEDIPLP